MSYRKRQSLADAGTDDNIYTGVSTFGVIMADIKAVIFSIIGIILIVAGILMMIKKSHRTSTISGTVKVTDCTEVIDNKNIYYECGIDVEYTINGKTQTKHFIDSNSQKKYAVGDTVTLWYDPNDNSNINIMSDDLHGLGLIFLIVGIVVIIFSILWAYLANKYKPVAAVEGVFTGANIITGRGI
jgi:uncharacterized membrane protein